MDGRSLCVDEEKLEMVLQYITELDDPLSAILEVSERDDGTAIYLDLHLYKMYR